MCLSKKVRFWQRVQSTTPPPQRLPAAIECCHRLPSWDLPVPLQRDTARHVFLYETQKNFAEDVSHSHTRVQSSRRILIALLCTTCEGVHRYRALRLGANDGALAQEASLAAIEYPHAPMKSSPAVSDRVFDNCSSEIYTCKWPRQLRGKP